MSPDRDERISLDGLHPEDALRALLAVDPDSEPVEEEDDEAEPQPSEDSGR